MAARKKPQEEPEPEAVSGEVVDEGPDPELAPAVDELLPAVVTDPNDKHEVMVQMDEADVQMLLRWAEDKAIKKWVYVLPNGKGEGLSVHGVQDIVQRMNWTGKARIGLLRDGDGRPVLDVEEKMADEGHGEELFYAVTAYAVDEVTGEVLPGASMEPQWQKLRNGGKKFDRYARWKAIQKATRNALGAHIPEHIEQAVIGLALKDPSRVERIRTEAEAKMAEMPPPLTDEAAVEKLARANAIYDEIRAIGPEATVEFPSGKFGAYKLNAQHSHDSLDAFLDYLAGERDRLREKYAGGDGS